MKSSTTISSLSHHFFMQIQQKKNIINPLKHQTLLFFKFKPWFPRSSSSRRWWQPSSKVSEREFIELAILAPFIKIQSITRRIISKICRVSSPVSMAVAVAMTVTRTMSNAVDQITTLAFKIRGRKPCRRRCPAQPWFVMVVIPMAWTRGRKRSGWGTLFVVVTMVAEPWETKRRFQLLF